MNEIIKAIKERRSIRKFTDQPIPQEAIDTILEAAQKAPSSMGKQARSYAVFKGKDIIAKLNERVKNASASLENSPYRAYVANKDYTINFKNGSLFIVVFSDPEITTSPEADSAVALENMFLAAHSLGIGSCWINQLNPLGKEPGFMSYMEEIGVPKGFVPYGSAVFGYADGIAKNLYSTPKIKENRIIIIE